MFKRQENGLQVQEQKSDFQKLHFMSLKRGKQKIVLKYMENLGKESCNEEQEKLEQSRDLEKY